MALQKITNKEIEEKQVASLPDRMTGTAAENKAAFDALVKAVIEKYNEVIETLSGLSGAESIGSEPFAGVEGATTVQAQLRKLQQNIADAVAGSIPDASITTAKLADGAVDGAKLADEAVTEAKIKDAEVTAAKIRDLAIETAKLANLAVTTAKIADGNVTTAKIADGAVTTGKLNENVISELTAGNAKIEYGTYTGTGTYGESNAITLTFKALPKFIVIIGEQFNLLLSTDNMSTSYTEVGLGSGSYNHCKKSGNSVSFYDGRQASPQANVSGIKYAWIAIR